MRAELDRMALAGRKKEEDPSSFFLFSSSFFAAIPGIVLLLPRLLYPMQMDQYFHHYLGWRLVHGGLPYVASFDQNFPGGAMLYAIGIAIFGQSSIGFAVYDLLVQSLTCYFIARLALRLFPSSTVAWIGPVLYALVYVGLGAWDVGQRDSFLAPMLLGLLLLLTRDRLTSVGWGASGFLVGIMAITRPLFVLTATLIVLAWWWKSKRPGHLALAAVAAAALPLIILGVYAVTGHLSDLYDATIAFNLEVYSKFRHGVNLRGSGTMSVTLALGIALYVVSRPRLRHATLLIAALLIAPFSTWIQGQGDPHHTTPTYAVAALLSALGFAWAFAQFRDRGTRKVAWIAMFVLVLFIAWRGIVREPTGLIAELLNGVDLRTLYEEQSRGDIKLSEEFAVADYIRTHTEARDPIYIFSMRIWPYELADRLPPTRFQSPEHLIMQPADQPLTDFQNQWRTEFMDSLRSHPPKLILITTTDQMWLYPHAEASIDQVKRFPEFQTFLRERYAPDTGLGAFRIYRRTS